MEDNTFKTDSVGFKKCNIQQEHQFACASVILHGSSPHDRFVSCMRRLLVSLDGYDNHSDILQAVPKVIVDYFNAPACWIDIFDKFSNSKIKDTYTSCLNSREHYPSPNARSRLIKQIFRHGKSISIDVRSLDNSYSENSSVFKNNCIITPIYVFNNIAGAITLLAPNDDSKDSLSITPLLDGVSMIVAQSIRASRLQSLLESNLLKETAFNCFYNTYPGINEVSNDKLDRVARIVAKSLFKEMRKAGFGSKQIINTTSEILSELSGHLKSLK